MCVVIAEVRSKYLVDAVVLCRCYVEVYRENDKRPEKTDLARWKCEMKEEHVNETDEEINSIKRQIFLGG